MKKCLKFGAIIILIIAVAGIGYLIKSKYEWDKRDKLANKIAETIQINDKIKFGPQPVSSGTNYMFSHHITLMI